MKTLQLSAALVFGFCSSFSVFAQTTIPIQNPSFESPSLSSFQWGFVDWDLGASGDYAGESSNSGTGYTGIDGSNFAFDDSTAIVYQNLSATFQPGTYTLTADLGQRPGSTNGAGGQIELWEVGGDPLATSGIQDEFVGSASGAFTPVTLTFTVTPSTLDSSGHLVDGQGISVIFAGGNNKGATGIGNADFDDFSLTYTVPEPSIFALVGISLVAGLAFLRRHSQIRI